MNDMSATAFQSGKSHRDENFPVASHLVAPRYRSQIMAFYRFARAADDVADHATAPAADRLAALAAMRAGIDGDGSAAEEAVALRTVANAHGLSLDHAGDLLTAFESDVRVARYADWDALIGYCRVSAMPVGRFVLDVHGEDRALWPLSDALCAALQVINHLQDCGKDYRALDRVYLPLDCLKAHGATVQMLAESASPAPLRAVIAELADRCLDLLDTAAPFAEGIRNRRLAAEVAVIHRLAASLAHRLTIRDPLSQRVHHNRLETVGLAGLAIASLLMARRG